ncbi:MAG: amidohydrolase [Clostridiales bacterium]|nr:amidohydrolase [Clostridiales bacterium]
MDNMEQKICQIIDERADEIIAFGGDIWKHAELGYQEFRTAGKFAQALKDLGLETVEGLALTGVKGYLKGNQHDEFNLCLMGEMDALPISSHVDANPETGASHCCGHHAQLTAVLGAAMALAVPEVREALGGNVVFCGVPAEEFVQLELRNQMRKEGKIRYGGGKCEMIRVGALDDIDMTVGHHSSNSLRVSVTNGTSNGFVNKMVTFHGKSAHAAGSPHKGLDALAAAGLALHCVDVQRESFRDQDTVRVHCFISKGGEAMNVIADYVTMEYSVRGKTIPAFVDANKKVDRALRAAAMATGCGLTIETVPGYLGTIPAEDTSAVVEACKQVAGEKYETFFPPVPAHGTGSTDYGDLSSLMPLIQFGTGGFSGQMHNPDVAVVDEYLAYVVPAKIFALSAYKLLKDGAARAKAIQSGFTPLLTKEAYLAQMESMLVTEEIAPTPLPILED